MKIRIFLICIVSCLPLGTAWSAETVDIREWRVPWDNAGPRDPYVANDGKVWFVGQKGNFVANLVPETGKFSRYDLDPDTGPHNLIIDDLGGIWYAGNTAGHIGRLDPATARIVKFDMPDDDARDPHTLAFDGLGNIWFTVQEGNFVGRLGMKDHVVRLMKVPTDDARPYGIAVDANGVPWVAEFGSNRLLRVDPRTLLPQEIALPNEDARPRRLVITSDNSVWYGDFARGYLGRYNPDNGNFSEWPMPAGADSRPYAMAVDKFDRIWIVETGVSPNRLVGFDTLSDVFFSITDLPEDAEGVRNMYYFEPAGELWFGTDTNYLVRARVH